MTYVVYFGTTTDPPIISNNSSSDPTYKPYSYNELTKYYWKVVAWDYYGLYNESDLWNFTTCKNLPPMKPINPRPKNHAMQIQLNQELGWSCSDKNNDVLTFDVYLGTINPPTTIVATIKDVYYSPTGLESGSTYYWKIRATDSHGAQNVSDPPVWDFTTIQQIPILKIGKMKGGILKMKVEVINANAESGENATNVSVLINITGNAVLKRINNLTNHTIPLILHGNGTVVVTNRVPFCFFSLISIKVKAWIVGRPDVVPVYKNVTGWIFLIFVKVKDTNNGGTYRFVSSRRQ
jgi:hypothetical protein